MNIVLFTHPTFLNSQSMPRFANMLRQAYIEKGHEVEVWAPWPKLHSLLPNCGLSKWLGYIDQYIIFPFWVRKQLKTKPANTLYVFCDQALGPWVPLVKNKPHIVHVHDLLALRSALGDIKENPTSLSGQIYQRYIRHGFRQAKRFISVSNKTRQDLHSFGQVSAANSEVVYNGLNYPFSPLSSIDAIRTLNDAGLHAPDNGMLLHLGGNQWYKNLSGVIKLYIEYAKVVENPLPLWCISPRANPKIQQMLNEIPPKGEVIFFQGIDNQALQAAYSLARVFIFPSLAEGFGWPIIEAQACGCPVITTDAAPMNEIGGSACAYIPILESPKDIESWSKNAANNLISLLSMNEDQRLQLSSKGLIHVQRFNAEKAIENYLKFYEAALIEAGFSQQAFSEKRKKS